MELNDIAPMAEAVRLGEAARGRTAPNPNVGCLIVRDGAIVGRGATAPGGRPHAEAVALAMAADTANSATLYTTLEPCSFIGRNPACAEMVIQAGVSRVLVGIADPDERVRGRGIKRMRAAGIEVIEGVRANDVSAQLAPYIKHRTTGHPYVVLKMAMTFDGRTAAPDGTSRWITGPAAREDVHRLRAESDAVIVGAGTVLRDDPSLRVRLDGYAEDRSPRRVVLGSAPENAKVRPALIWQSDPVSLLDRLGNEGCLQVLLEGGAAVAGEWHRRKLVDSYIVYLAPAALGGDDGAPLFSGPGARSMEDVWRGSVVDVRQFGDDVRITVRP